MADTFTFVKDGKKKVYNIAGGTEEEAMKYVRYLHRNALFGTHTGLPPQIKNSKMNESLVSNIGDYSVLDVYAKQLTKCMIGTVVNFILDDTVNPLGETYVYPCTDKNKPMGYMISDATPDTMGVCLVHGVLEVPLYYFGAEGEKKNYVEYDLENACFKFSDSGYPVFNVYQDVDGDWIAIILFGDVSSDYEYAGPFAVSVAGVTGSTTYVNINSGDVLFNDIRGTYDEDLTTQVALNTGESVWLKTSITGNTHAYDLIATSTTPIDGSTVFYTELAKNIDGNIVQNQYGDIRYSRTKLIAGSNRIILSPANGLGDVTIDVNESAVGTTQDLTLTGSTVFGSTASIGITDSTSKINIVPENDLYVRKGAGTNELIIGSTTTAYTNVATSVSGTNDASISFSNINGLAKTIHIKAGSNIQLSADGTTGIIVSATGGSVTPYVQDLTHSFSTGTATLGLTGSAITVSFTTAGNTYIEEGSNGEIVIGSTSGNLMCASTDSTDKYAIYISDSSEHRVYLKAENGVTIGLESGSTNTLVLGSTFSEFEYDGPFAVKVDHVDESTPTTLYVIVNAGVITYEKNRRATSAVTTSTSLSSGQSYWLKYNTVSDAISYYKASSPQADSNNVIQVKLAENVGGVLKQVQFGEIVLSKPNLTKIIEGGTAYIGLTGGTNTVVIKGTNGVVLSNDGGNNISLSVNGWGTFVTGITSSVGTNNSATISTVGGSGSVVLLGGTDTYIESGDNGEIIIGSTVSGNTGTVTGITSSISGTTAFVSTIGGIGDVVFYGVGGTTISGGTNGEIVIGSTVGGGSDFTYTGSFKVTCWDTYDEDDGTIHNFSITDSNNRDDYDALAGWVHIGNKKYPVLSYFSNFVDGDVVYLVGTFNDSNDLSNLEFRKIQTFFPTINDNQFCVRICYATNGTMYQTQYGDIVQPARLVGDGETVEIHSNVISAIGGGGGGTVQGLYSAIKGGTPAICITGSTTYVPIAGGTNTYTERDSSGAIIVGSTASGGGGGSAESILITGATVHDLIAGNRYIVLCPRVFVGGDLRNQYNSETTIRNALINSGHTNVPSTGYSDDEGDIMLVLPENLVQQTTIEVKVNTKGGAVLVVTADSKKIIVADSDGEQGVSAGIYTKEIAPDDSSDPHHWLFVYVNDVSSWPVNYEDEIHGSIISNAITNDGGCWVIIPM